MEGPAELWVLFSVYEKAKRKKVYFVVLKLYFWTRDEQMIVIIGLQNESIRIATLFNDKDIHVFSFTLSWIFYCNYRSLRRFMC